MRIAFITPEYVTEAGFDGGLSTYLGRICPLLAGMGHDVVVFVRSDHDEVLNRDGVEVRRVTVNPVLIEWANKVTFQRLRAASHWLGQSWALHRAYIRVNRSCRFDLVQYASYTGTGFFRLRDVPSVVRISSYEPVLQQAYGYPFTLENRSRMWIEKQAICNSDAIFGPSRHIAEIVGKELGRLVEVIESPFVPEGGDLDDKIYLEQLHGKKYLLFFGSLSKLKGVHLIAEIVGKVLNEHPEVCFVFAGKCFSYLGRPIMDHVWEKAGAARNRVIYLGRMRHNQLYPVVANAYAVVLPSLTDNLPNTCIEAMSFNRVVIGSRGASFDQLIEHGVSGFLCDNDSSQSLYQEVCRVLALPADRYAAIGVNAGRRIEALCPEQVVTKLLDFYHRVARQ